MSEAQCDETVLAHDTYVKYDTTVYVKHSTSKIRLRSFGGEALNVRTPHKDSAKGVNEYHIYLPGLNPSVTATSSRDIQLRLMEKHLGHDV